MEATPDERAAIAAIRDSARTLAADVDVSELYGEFLAQMTNPEDPFYGEEAQGGLLRAVRGRAAGKRAAAAAARAASGALPPGLHPPSRAELDALDQIREVALTTELPVASTVLELLRNPEDDCFGTFALLRFLRGNEGDANAALEKLHAALVWWAENGMDDAHAAAAKPFAIMAAQAELSAVAREATEKAGVAEEGAAGEGDRTAARKALEDAMRAVEHVMVLRMTLRGIPHALQVLPHIPQVFARTTDRLGNQVMIVRVKEFMAHYNPQGLMEHVPAADYLANRKCGTVLNSMMYNLHSRLAGGQLRMTSMLIDFTGFQLSMVQKNRNAFEEYTGSYDKESKDVFPESLHRIYCVNCPWYVRFGWTMVKKAVPTKTSEKFRVWGTGFYADLCKEIDPAEMPASLGGTNAHEFIPWESVPELRHLAAEEGAGNIPEPDPAEKVEVGSGNTERVRVEVAAPEKAAAEGAKGAAGGGVEGEAKDVGAGGEGEKGGESGDDGCGAVLWRVKVVKNDINFRVFFCPAGKDESVPGNCELVEEQEKAKDIFEGSYKCKEAGTVILEFDNSYSWMTSKSILYDVEVMGGNMHMPALGGEEDAGEEARVGGVECGGGGGEGGGGGKAKEGDAVLEGDPPRP